MSVRIEQYDGGEVLYIALDPDGVMARSEFPDELLTLDYNAQGGLIGIEAIGSLAREGATALLRTISEHQDLDNQEAVKQALEPVAA
jgi:uncharacterized protein YuzE